MFTMHPMKGKSTGVEQAQQGTVKPCLALFAVAPGPLLSVYVQTL